MSNFVTHWHFFKNPYSKPYIVRILFEVRVPAFCSLVADNMCRCDYWFSREGNVKIKYDVIDDDNTNRTSDEIAEKSILVDLNGPFTASSKMELLVTDGNGRSDHFHSMVSDVPDDPMVTKED